MEKKIEFIETSGPRKVVAYAVNGWVKTYTNRAQVEKKVAALNASGYNVTYTASFPFLIVPVSPAL